MLYFAPWKTALIGITVLLGLVFVLPNALDRSTLENWPGFLPNKQINLGLDLQGGSHLLLEVEVDAVVLERREAIIDDVRDALRAAKVGYRNLGLNDTGVEVTIREGEDYEVGLAALKGLSQPLGGYLMASGVGRDLAIEELDNRRVSLSLTPEAIEKMGQLAVQQSIEIVRRRIDELGTREPTIQRQGSDRILVQLPGVDDPDRIKSLLGKTAKLAFRMVNESYTPQDIAAGKVRGRTEVLPDDENQDFNWAIYKRVIVSGESLVDAQPGVDSQTNEPVVNFRFDSAGARRFGDATRKNVGKPFAIVLDGRVISAPVIREPILGGTGQISGSFTFESANDLAVLLRAGALPAPLTILEERTVGPDLGADSIAAGKIACLIAFLGVMVYMGLAYGPFGLFANGALIINLAMLGGVLSLFQATLTLPGIAGIVLTIGMAVDANVLIFERIREELANGKSPLNAVDAGYSRALGTILDANITTFIAAAILFAIGSGPIKGFSVTLAIGIATSVFTAFTLTRLLVASWLKARRPAQLVV
ncbi:MAG: protein translocase subunit SecD [Alphaproteobacteria bacterium]